MTVDDLRLTDAHNADNAARFSYSALTREVFVLVRSDSKPQVVALTQGDVMRLMQWLQSLWKGH